MKTRRSRFAKFFHRKSRIKPLSHRRFTLWGVEQLEQRSLLTADAALHGGWYDSQTDAFDTIPTMRSMISSSCTSPSSSNSSNSSSADTASSASAMAMTANDGGGDPEVNPLVDPFRARFRLEVENMADAPITTINVGQDFQLAVFVQDLRTPPLGSNSNNQPLDGVWSAFLNVNYNSALASITSTAHSASLPDPAFEFGSYFANRDDQGVSSAVLQGDVSTPGQIIDAGSTSLRFSGSGASEVLLWRITVHATAAGELTFTPSFFEDDEDASAFIQPNPQGSDDLDLVDGQIDFVADTIQIVGLPVVSVTAPVATNEGNSASTPFAFVVSLDHSSTDSVSVVATTSNGSATAGSDYQAGTQTLTFAPGETLKTMTILVNGDNSIETDETFSLTLSAPSNATLSATPSALATIKNDDTPTLGISAVSQLEGDSDGPMVFTVTTSQASATDVVVPWLIQAGSATAGDDYTAASGTLTFLAGNGASQLITVNIKGDTNNETNEDFTVVLAQPNNAAFDASNGQAKGTILNDDGPHITFTNLTVTHQEGGTGVQTQYVFEVNIGVASAITVKVPYSTANGTASSASDYTAQSGTLTFLSGDPLSQKVTILVSGDTLPEGDEDFKLNLGTPENATLTDSSATGVITNDDLGPMLSVTPLTPTVTEGNAGSQDLVLSVSLSATSGQNVTVVYDTNNGSATTADSDYLPISLTTLTFLPGETQKLVTVKINGDTKHEADEDFLVDFFNAVGTTNAGSLADKISSHVIIQDNDAAPTLTIQDVSINEGNSGTTSFIFVASLSAPAGVDISVPFTTQDDTATTGDTDYTATSGTLLFTAGQTSKTITVLGTGDLRNETDESFKLVLTPAAHVQLARTTIVGTLKNDDSLPQVFVTGGGSKNEGNSDTTPFVFTVSLTAASGQQVTVDYTTVNGTATVSNDDYVGQSGQLTFAPGETSKVLTVAVKGDAKNETDETFTFAVTNPKNANLPTSGNGNSFAQALIVNDDPLPKISISNVSQSEGDSGTSDFVFQVTLNGLSGQNVTVVYTTADGTAKAGSDYIATSGTLTFGPGVGSQNVSVQVKGDRLVESGTPETFFINLTNPTNSEIQTAQGKGEIVSESTDDQVFTVSSITGVAFSDVDNNKIKETVQEAIQHVTVTLSGTSSVSGAITPRVIETDATGKYTFGDIEPGNYTVIFKQPVGWRPATAVKGTSAEVTLADSSALGFKFAVGDVGGVDSVGNNLSVPGWDLTKLSNRVNTTSFQQARSGATSTSATAFAAISDASSRSSLASDNGLFTQDGDTLTVHGTSGDDSFEFIAGTSSHTVKINGVSRTIDPASIANIVFDGGDGDDTATMTGTSAEEGVDATIGSGTLTGANFKVTANSVRSLTVNGGGGTDVGTLHDTALADHLTGEGNSLSIANDLGEVTKILAFEQVEAISNKGGADTDAVGSIDFSLDKQGDWEAV